MKLQK